MATTSICSLKNINSIDREKNLALSFVIYVLEIAFALRMFSGSLEVCAVTCHRKFGKISRIIAITSEFLVYFQISTLNLKSSCCRKLKK